MRVRLIKNFKKYKVGQIVEVSNNEAFGLIDSGVAVVSKEMTNRDYKTKGKK